MRRHGSRSSIIIKKSNKWHLGIYDGTRWKLCQFLVPFYTSIINNTIILLIRIPNETSLSLSLYIKYKTSSQFRTHSRLQEIRKKKEEKMENLLGLLRIHVKRGVNLAIRDIASSDPYIVFHFGNKVKIIYFWPLCISLLVSLSESVEAEVFVTK